MAIILPTNLNDYGRKVYTLGLKCYAKDNGAIHSGDVEVLINDGGLDVSGIVTLFSTPDAYEGMQITLTSVLPIASYKVLSVSGAGISTGGYATGIKVFGENVIFVLRTGMDNESPEDFMNGYMDYFTLQISYVKL